jgi:8-oxo-dGTP pyrophosphatase MutT (NUDIX family)
VVRRTRGRWMVAAIRPGGKKPGIWALPKGGVGAGEDPALCAIREVEEETGVQARLVTKLGDVRYVYTWAGERVFKVVSFYLLRYSRGRLGEILPEMRVEVDEARWLPLTDGPRLLAYGGERQMVEKALAVVGEDGL